MRVTLTLGMDSRTNVQHSEKKPFKKKNFSLKFCHTPVFPLQSQIPVPGQIEVFHSSIHLIVGSFPLRNFSDDVPECAWCGRESNMFVPIQCLKASFQELDVRFQTPK